MFKLGTPVGVGTLALVLSACGDNPLGTNSGDPLAAAEIQAVFNEFTRAFSSLGSSPAPVGGPAAVSIDEGVDASVSCAAGESIDVTGSVSGTVDEQTYATDLRFELELEPHGCVVTTEGGSVTVHGDPHVRVIMDMTMTDTEISLSGSLQGGLRYTASDGRSGSCAIDVTFIGATDASSGSGTHSVSGAVCGMSAEEFEIFGAG